MTLAGGMIGILIFWYLVAPKSFGRHFAECADAYTSARATLRGGAE